jgi:hypothetical protein
MLRSCFAFLATVALVACAEPIETISKQTAFPEAIVSLPSQQQTELNTFARNFLDSIQAQSIADRREYCGYFFRNAEGEVKATPPRRGTFASCSMPVPRRGDGIFASYHTHGAYGRQYDNEVPSTTDLLSDFQLGLDGYISTPGGRIWHVSSTTRDARQVCGLGCVTRDPGFVPRNEGNVRQRYTIVSLNQRAGA